MHEMKPTLRGEREREREREKESAAFSNERQFIIKGLKIEVKNMDLDLLYYVPILI
jgi:hypothetical protein